MKPTPVRVMALLGALAVVVCLHPLRGVPSPGSWPYWAQAAPEDAVAALAACAGWLLALWLAVVLGLGMAADLLPRGSRLARALTGAVRTLVPRGLRPVLRPLVGVALGGAIALGPSATAMASDIPQRPPASATTAGALAAGAAPAAPGQPQGAEVAGAPLGPVPDPVVAPPESPPPVLDWVTSQAVQQPTGAAVPDAAPAHLHRVVPGDTLWDIAAAGLPAEADPGQITNAWQQIYAANRAVVGPDPSFLVPGELLVLDTPR